MVMHNPPHPGSILKEDVLPALNMQVQDAAHQLGVTRVQFSRFINGHARVTPDLAIRLSKWIPAPTASMWLQMQAEFDLWQANHSGKKFNVIAYKAKKSTRKPEQELEFA
jgi:addiction module HigA family antidote